MATTLRSIVVATCVISLFYNVPPATAEIAETSVGPARIQVQPVNPWTHLDFRDDAANFQFAIIGDRTGGPREGVFQDGLAKLNLLQPEFVMSAGDLIKGYTEDRDVLKAEWDEFESFVSRLEMPFFYLAGNHDITNSVMAEVWEERFGASYYSFLYKDVLFLCLNSEDGEMTNISDAQIEWARETLSRHDGVRWTLVFIHKPLWRYESDDGDGVLRDTGWAEIEAAIARRRHTVFAGHFHSYFKHVRHRQNYFTLATTGGGSGLRGPMYGEFDHVVWVTMTGEGPVVASTLKCNT